MRRFLLSLLMIFLMGSLKIVNAQLLQWNTFGNAGTETFEPSVFNDPNLSGITNLTLGAGVTPAANGNRFGGNAWFDAGDTNPTTLTESVTGNDYIQFIVTPNAGFSFTPTSFVFNWDHSATGPASVTLRSSVDGFVADLGSVTGMPASISVGNTITITGLTALTTATTFRLYGYSATAAGGTGGFDVAASAVNVQLNGTTASTASNTITTGTVLTPPFVLTNCLDTETGTVDFTSTDVFNVGNIFTAQLSDDVGSFSSPVFLGSISGPSAEGPGPSGTINITIPAGTVGGVGYRIRVISSSPVVTGSSSAAFTIVQQGVGGCASSNTDYYRSFQTGDWASVSTWESSPDNTNWISATLPPTSLANTITIRNTHTVTVAASASADQLVIQGGGILEHTLGTFTIEDGTGADIDINGIFTLSSISNAPVFNGAATCNVATAGILRVSATGLTGAGTGVNSNNYVYQNSSILEYTPAFAFSSSGVTFFPNVDAVTVPIFRTTNTGAILVGAGAGNTAINGIFECNGSDVSWQLAGTKTFRNGIRGTGNVIALANSGKFIINGLVAVLGGAGSLIVPVTDGLEIGASTTVFMISDKTITGNVSLLTDTYVELGVNNLTVSGTVSNATITSYVKTNGTGKLILLAVGSGFSGKLFPIGLTSINPIFISSGSISDYSARIVEPITPPIYADLQAVLRTWYISSSVNTPNAIISFGYSFPGDCGLLYSNAGPAELGVNIGGVWNIHQTGLTPAAFPLVPGTFTVTPTIPINHFNNPATEFPYVIANNFAILSIDCIISTRAQKRNNTGIISWTVNSCAGLNNFEVQRSVNNSGFRTIGTVHPVVNQTDFSFTDPALAGGTNLYRIKVNGFTGSSKYSNTVALIHNSNDILISSLAPNPVHNKAMLVVSSGRNTEVDFKVYNMSGSLVKQWQSNVTEGNNTIEVNLAGLSAGIHSIFAYANGATTITRFVKQ